MSVQLKLSGSGSRTFIAEIVTLPAEVKLPAPALNRYGNLFAGLIFTIIGYLTLKLSGETGLNLRTLLSLCLGAYGGLLLAKTLFAPNGQTTMIFQEDEVEVITNGWLKKVRWREPLDNFKGLALRTKETPSRPNKAPYQIIELIHNDASKTLPLYAARASTPPTDHLEHYADILGVPVLNQS